MKTAKDLMTAQVITISTEDRLAHVIEVFRTHGLTMAPVIDPKNQIVGVLTELSLVKAFAFHQLQKGRSETIGAHQEILDPVTFIKETGTLIEVVTKILRSPTHRVVVVDRPTQKKVVGIVSPKDIISYIDGGDQKEESDDLITNLAKTKEDVQQLSDHQDIMERYSEQYEATPIMMFALAGDGEILMANKKLHMTLGYPGKSLVGQSIFELFAEDDQKEALKIVRELKKHGGQFTNYFACNHKDGHPVRVELASTALTNQKGEFVCTISAARVLDSDSVLGALMSVLGNSDGETEDKSQKAG